jgi:D-sedoheptulose 7-phosphate isomerase
MSYAEDFLGFTREAVERLDRAAIERMAALLRETRDRGGRLFLLGVGGSAANASHAANDFRKLCGLEAYAPSDNVSELTARTNDEGWETVFSEWLKVSRLGPADAVWVFSVGGGSLEKGVSVNLVRAVQLAKERGARVLGTVGRDGGFTAREADACVIVPTLSGDSVTPIAESMQAVVSHLLASHPMLSRAPGKWESLR